jgi:hypothetical protein
MFMACFLVKYMDVTFTFTYRQALTIALKALLIFLSLNSLMGLKMLQVWMCSRYCYFEPSVTTIWHVLELRVESYIHRWPTKGGSPNWGFDMGLATSHRKKISECYALLQILLSNIIWNFENLKGRFSEMNSKNISEL